MRSSVSIEWPEGFDSLAEVSWSMLTISFIGPEHFSNVSRTSNADSNLEASCVSTEKSQLDDAINGQL